MSTQVYETGRCLNSLLSNSAVSCIVIPFDIFETAQAAHVKVIQSIAITYGQVRDYVNKGKHLTSSPSMFIGVVGYPGA